MSLCVQFQKDPALLPRHRSWLGPMGRCPGWGWVLSFLVGGIPTPLKKYEFVSWDDSSQSMEKIKHVPNHQPASFERCSKLQLKLNGNYSSLREIPAPSLHDHNGSLRAVNFSNWACATLREDEFLRFGAFLLARCRHEADFGLGFLGFSDSRLARLFLSFSTSWLVRWLLDF